MPKLVALFVALAACGGSPAPAKQPATAAPTAALAGDVEDRCTPRPGVDAEAERKSCTAKGCTYGQELSCGGAPPDPADREARLQASRAGKTPCACVCEADVQSCIMAP